MQPGEALGIAAQVAIALAGFAGIVVVFRPESVHQWTALDKFRLRLLLANSALPLAYSMVAILLLSVDPPLSSIWRWCSMIAFSTQVFTIVLSTLFQPKIPRGQIRHINRPLFYSIAAIGTAAMALQAVNFAKWNRFWPFFTMILVHLLAALAQFLRLVLLPPHESQ